MKPYGPLSNFRRLVRAERGHLTAWARLPVGGLLFSASIAMGQPVQWHGELAVASELSDRGLSVGPRQPVLQGQLSAWIGPHWTAAISTTVQKGESGGRTVARLAYSSALSNDWQAELGLTSYRYSSTAAAPEHLELGATAIFHDLWSVTLAALHYAGAPGRPSGPVWALETGLRWPLAANWSLNASLGQAELPYVWGRRYLYGSVGIGWEWGGWRAGLDRIGTDGTARALLAPLARSRWSAVVAKEF